VGGVTVPGKGGRPRKWRSDADRVRAFRARQRGAQEPPELAVALADGDELAVALDELRQFRSEAADAARAVRQLRRDLRGAKDELTRQKRQHGWLNDAFRRLLEERNALVAERDELRAGLDSLRRARAAEPSARADPQATPPTDRTPAPISRAERRRREREQRRRQS
jgi:chromosome segregation ATPase